MIGTARMAGVTSSPILINRQRARSPHHAGDGHVHREASQSRVSATGARAGRTAPARTGSSRSRQHDRSPRNLDPEERQEIAELQARDREVRAHETAHRAAGGRYAGPVSYEYAVGPDGRRYATGGEVAIDASPVPGDPESTVRKMDVVVRAALAPAQPSAQDRAVAARARQLAAKARQEMVSEKISRARSPEGSFPEDRTGQPAMTVGVQGSMLNMVV